jgi:Fe-S cluster assembly iron-binding protein IscA
VPRRAGRGGPADVPQATGEERYVLTLTENAQTAVETLTTRAGLPDEGGLRIAEQDSGGFELALVAEPAPGDDVVAQGAARVYVDQRTSQSLADQQLDVEPAGEGTAFTLTRQ